MEQQVQPRICYRLGEAAKMLGLSDRFLRNEIRAKRLVAVRFTRAILIEATAIDEWLAKRRTA